MIGRIWTRGPPYAFAGEFWNFHIKKAIAKLGIGVMPKALRPRRAADLRRSVESNSVRASRGRAAEVRSRRPCARVGGGQPLGHVLQGLREAGRVPDGANWLVKYVLVAGSDAEARARVSQQSSYRYAFGAICWKCSPAPDGWPASNRAPMRDGRGDGRHTIIGSRDLSARRRPWCKLSPVATRSVRPAISC